MADSTTEEEKTRPKNWGWTTSVTKGRPVSTSGTSCYYLTATEWIGFADRINEFYDYLGKTNSYYDTMIANVSRGNPMKASHFNAARSAINALSPPTSVPGRVTAGSSKITAAQITGLAASLNSIE